MSPINFPQHESRLLVLLCTYNELDNLKILIPLIQEQLPETDLIVVDDNSPDGTGEYVKSLSEEYSRVHLISRIDQRGLGSAVIAGCEYALSNQYDHLLTMDADLSHPPKYIPDLLALMQSADVAIGSRYVAGGGVVGWDWKRKLMSWGVNVYSRVLLGLPNKDNSGNFRCYRLEKLAELDFRKVHSTGYAFMEEILYRCQRVGCRFVETPIVFEDRTIGESKITMSEAVKAIWIIFRLSLERLCGVSVRKD
ncbi:MAG: polyprenol monophosphomannose synthase [Planctomycetaceae bacterium]|nr:polyprenol monophosphomannose synthase [Planctomycetaceae bacterium]MDB4786684.1 polyprenol monophosphomannose synthase [Planctomycetaceae bacterium]MDC0273138.1 polyprenol monophosphomannose synthase [Planctomycetaceae bacterium]MDG2391770.1 polyprenol monophosphomannose synthase [Planctomycetaceae bacterium]